MISQKHSGVAIFHIAVPRGKFRTDADVAAFYERLLQHVRNLPGITHAGMVTRLPLDGGQTMSTTAQLANGDTVHLDAIDSRPATPDYFAALGIAVRSGRTFTEHDDGNSPAVAVVDDQLARSLWHGTSAVGQKVRRPDGTWSTVVGVVAHVHAEGLDVDPRPQIYWSYRQVTQDRMVLAVRGIGEPAALVGLVIQAIHAADPEQPVYDVRTMPAVVNRSLAQRRLTTSLIASFGAIALLLASVGVYGVVAYGVTQRLREFGIRVALGATRRNVAGMVVGQDLGMAAVGAGIGLVCAIALGGAMSNLIYGIQPRDVLSLVAGTGVLLLVAAVASFIPARRASAVDPAVTLRSE